MGERLEGKVVLVTGAGQASAGHRLGSSQGRCGGGPGRAHVGQREAVASEIADLGGKAIPLLCDVADRAQVDAAVAATAEAFGGLDAIVNNAAVGAQKLLADLTDEEVEKSWRVETMGTSVRHASRASAPAQNGGAIVNFGSTTAIEGNASFGAYAMSKEAIRDRRAWPPASGAGTTSGSTWSFPTLSSPPSQEFANQHPSASSACRAVLALRRVGDPSWTSAAPS
ncbi:SDR family NAD(P)-dependent oxidoreductase [Streptomyces sp. KL116D]|uniref:SDR family NAD(P)-dependent oxidoreductase n=1 Tax=Streptomyces sp. KL116D TaxID=3045152 RepID=UPI003557C548